MASLGFEYLNVVNQLCHSCQQDCPWVFWANECLKFDHPDTVLSSSILGVLDLFEPANTFGILAQVGRPKYKMAASGGKASHKMSGTEVIGNSNVNSSTSQTEVQQDVF